MPRLNYGTLLENIVVLESTRLGLEHTAAEDALGFATSFAMPPITQCWCKVSEDAGNPRFNHAFLLRLGTRLGRPASRSVARQARRAASVVIRAAATLLAAPGQ